MNDNKISKLLLLKELYEKGVITKEQLEQKKAMLLTESVQQPIFETPKPTTPIKNNSPIKTSVESKITRTRKLKSKNRNNIIARIVKSILVLLPSLALLWVEMLWLIDYNEQSIPIHLIIIPIAGVVGVSLLNLRSTAIKIIGGLLILPSIIFSIPRLIFFVDIWEWWTAVILIVSIILGIIGIIGFFQRAVEERKEGAK